MGMENNNLYPLVNRIMRLLIIPVLVTTIFEIAALYTPNTRTLLWIANGVLSVFIVKTILEKAPLPYQLGAWVGALALGSVGFLLALTQLLIYRRVWYFFQLISQPALFALAGGIFCGVLLFMMEQMKNRRGVKS